MNEMNWKTNAFMTMLKGMGFPVEQTMKAANDFVSNGTMDKILAFADALPALVAEMKEQNARLERIEARLGIVEHHATAGGGNIIALAPRAGASDGVGTGPVGTGSNEAMAEQSGTA